MKTMLSNRNKALSTSLVLSFCVAGVSIFGACTPKSDTTPAVQQLSAHGTDSSGGGDHIITTSSPDDVRAAIERSQDMLSHYFMWDVAEDRSNLTDPELIKIVNTMLAGGSPIDNQGIKCATCMAGSAVEKDIANSTFVVKDHGPCLSIDGTEVDASVAAFSLGSNICFSIERLGVIPREAEPAQVTALAAHEFSHHFGFDEMHAQKIQNYFLEEIMTGKASTRSFISNNYDQVYEALVAMGPSPSCQQMTNITNTSDVVNVDNLGGPVEMWSVNSTVQKAAVVKFVDSEVTPLIAGVRKFASNVCSGTSNSPVTIQDLANQVKTVETDAITKLYGMRF